MFICYETTTGSDLAENLQNALRKRGIVSFVAKPDLRKHIREMKTWKANRDEALKTAHTFILILSFEELTSSEIIYEFKFAIWRNKRDSTFSIIIAHDKIIPRTQQEILSSMGIDTAEFPQIDFDTKEKLARIISSRLNDDGTVREPRSKYAIPENIEFKEEFSSVLTIVTRLLEKSDGRGPPTKEVESSINKLVMLFKKQIDNWDFTAVEFATKELFMKLYKFTENDYYLELYSIFKDLFERAHSVNLRIVGTMINAFNEILLESWIPKYDVEKGEEAARVLLRLGIDFLKRDHSVTRVCAMSINDLAMEMYEPQILSKEIILATCAHEMVEVKPEMKDFVDELVDLIQSNDQLASEQAHRYTYLTKSIDYAHAEQGDYGINITNFEEQFLYPRLKENINANIEDYVNFLTEFEIEDRDSVTSATYDLIDLITVYESVCPNIAFEIGRLVSQMSVKSIEEMFNHMVEGSKFLTKIYRGSEMLSTFDELIRFLEVNSDSENIGVGMKTWGFTTIKFARKLSREEQRNLETLAQKHGILYGADFKLDSEEMMFTVDFLAYPNKSAYDVGKLVAFLKDVNNTVSIASYSTGIDIGLRKLSEKNVSK